MKLSNKLLIAAIAAALAGMTQGVYAKADKVTVCHKGKTLSIASAALAAHLGHGDTEGACAVAEKPVAEEPAAEEPTAEEPTVEEPTVEEPTAEEPTAEEPTAEEPTAEESQDPRELEDIPPVDEIEGAIPAEPTHEEIVAQLLIKAEGLTEASLEGGFLLLPEVQVSVFGTTVSYAVVLELEDGSTTLVVAAVKEVESREGVVSATYSLESGQAIIPVVNVAAAEEAATEEVTTVAYYNVVLAVVNLEPIEFIIESFSETPPEVVAEEEAPAEDAAAEEAPAEDAAAEEAPAEEATAEEEAPAEEAVAEEEAPAEEVVAEEEAPTEEAAAEEEAPAEEAVAEEEAPAEEAVAEEEAPTEEAAAEEEAPAEEAPILGEAAASDPADEQI